MCRVQLYGCISVLGHVFLLVVLVVSSPVARCGDCCIGVVRYTALLCDWSCTYLLVNGKSVGVPVTVPVTVPVGVPVMLWVCTLSPVPYLDLPMLHTDGCVQPALSLMA